MSKLDLSSFPSLASGQSEVSRPTGAWTQAPKIPRKRVEISRSSRLGGIWLARWRAFGDDFFSTYTCGWVADTIDRPISSNPIKEAETFFHWFIEELKLYGLDGQFLEAFDVGAPVYIQKTIEIFSELRTSQPEVDEADVFKAHWFIILEHPPNAKTTADLAFKMVQSGRWNVKSIVEQLWQEIVRRLSPTERQLWKDLDQIGGWTEKMKSETCPKMEAALRTLIAWLT